MDLHDEEESSREPYSYKEEEQQRERCTIQARRQYSRAGAKLAARQEIYVFTWPWRTKHSGLGPHPPSLAAQEEHECKGLTCLLKVSSWYAIQNSYLNSRRRKQHFPHVRHLSRSYKVSMLHFIMLTVLLVYRNDHTTVTAPLPVCSAKLSTVGPG